MGQEYKREIVVLGQVPSMGPVILFDDLEGIFKWIGYGTGADYVVERSQVNVFNGSYNLHLKTRTTGAAVGDSVQAWRTCSFRRSKKMRLELIWYTMDMDNVAYLTLDVFWLDGATSHRGSVRFDRANGIWQYLNSVGGWSNIVGSGQVLGGAAFVWTSIEIDFAKNEYVELRCASVRVDMAGLGIYQVASALGEKVTAQILFEDALIGATDMYFDDVLVMEA